EPALGKLHSAQLAEDAANGAMLDMETGVRGYQLSADRRFLAPYLSGKAAYPAAVKTAYDALTELPDAQTRWRAADAIAATWQAKYAAGAVTAAAAGESPSVDELLAGKGL